MDSLAKLAIDAHGGLDRWRQFETLSSQLSQGGMLWQLKGQAGTLDDTTVTVGLRRMGLAFPFSRDRPQDQVRTWPGSDRGGRWNRP